MNTRKIGLLVGDEDDWPATFESIIRRAKPEFKTGGDTLRITTERMRIHPFSLRASTSYNLVIDRLAYWYTNPREWLKKAAILNNVYLLNNPFTFQSMEKHSAYCVMMRCGLHIPETWLIPSKGGPADPTFQRKYQVTAGRYNDLFDLPAIARSIGYPLYMKPFDGGGWRGVSRIADEQALMRNYDDSGQMMMHLQRGLDGFDIFIRSLAIGPQVMTMHYDPDKPHHDRYQISHGFLSAEKGVEARRMVKLINSFFRWEFNSCECIVKDGTMWAIDFANACPDIAVNSLHYYYPWALGALVKWCLFCTATGRQAMINMEPHKFFSIADNTDLSYDQKLEAYEKVADEYFQTAQFEEFCAKQLPHLDEVVWEYFRSEEFDDLLVYCVRTIFKPHEHEQFIAHFRGIYKHWVDTNNPRR